MSDAYRKSITQLQKLFHSSPKTGLSTEQIAANAEKFGINTIGSPKEQSRAIVLFFRQWKSPLILILVAAAIISALLHEYIDMTIITVTAFLNALIGFSQEYKADTALKRLRSMISFSAVVLRNGEKIAIDASEVVVGDIVELSAGNKVPADGRVIRAEHAFVNEAALTGESVAVAKQAKLIKKETPLAEQKNMVFRGTTVVSGTLQVLVTAVGEQTEIGRIAALVRDTKEEQTPLQIQLSKLARNLTILVIGMAVSLFIIGALFANQRYETIELFEVAIAVAVAAIPEGLVISLTVILAIGMQFILKKRALVRKLVAAETLGSVSVICSDKTGTITEGNMSVVKAVCASGTVHKDQFGQLTASDEAYQLLRSGLLCNDAIMQTDESGTISFSGNMTDIALFRAANQSTAVLFDERRSFNRLAELPFSSAYKYMAVLGESEKNVELLVKGAPEVLLEKASHILVQGKEPSASLRIKKLTKQQQTALVTRASSLATNGYRTLLIAQKVYKKAPESLTHDAIEGLTILGIVAIADPIRKDVAQTLKIAQQAGVRVMMITGDHAKTAKAIATELGLINKNSIDPVCEGKDLDQLTDGELLEKLKHTVVFARVAPVHKIRIVELLQASGEVVSMTGDGVNDAPALKGADIGVAVGSGTDVAKDTADMVLLDDSFSTIVAAIEQGRGIYENIRKVLVYLLSGTFAEVIMIIGSILAGLPVAALPAQILFVNIIEDAFPTMALAFDKADNKNMQDPPRKKDEPIINAEMKAMIIAKSVLSNVMLFSIYYWIYNTTQDVLLSRTIVFVGFAIDSLFIIFSFRNLRRMIWNINPFTNKYLLLAMAGGWAMLFLAIYAPPMQLLLRTVPLSGFHWMILFGFGLFNLLLMELIKGIYILYTRRQERLAAS